MARSVVVLLSKSKMTWLNMTQSSSSMGVVVPVNVKTISLRKLRRRRKEMWLISFHQYDICAANIPYEIMI